jgi:hypothetical protein
MLEAQLDSEAEALQQAMDVTMEQLQWLQVRTLYRE